MEELSLGDLQQIELILLEANAWGLRWEVEEAAQIAIKDGIHPVTAYEWAFNDWVK